MSDTANNNTNSVPNILDECTFGNCVEPVLATCRNCNLQYCLTHASEVDPEHYCSTCLVPADASVTVAPLVDADGVQHQGRLIKPAGKAYRLSSKMVYEMTDQELKDFIEHEKSVVRDIENIREYHMITLGMAESDAYRREISTLAKVGGVLKWGTSTQRVPAIRHKATPVEKQARRKDDKINDIVANLNALGFTPEQLAQLIKGLPKKGDKK
jgi:hypothetical protein